MLRAVLLFLKQNMKMLSRKCTEVKGPVVLHGAVQTYSKTGKTTGPYPAQHPVPAVASAGSLQKRAKEQAVH